MVLNGWKISGGLIPRIKVSTKTLTSRVGKGNPFLLFITSLLCN